MASRGRKACFNVAWRVLGAALLSGGALVIGCSHAWDDLEPISGAGGTSTASRSTGGKTSNGSGDDGPTTSSSSAVSSSSAQASSAAISSSSAAKSSSSSGMGLQITVPASVAACSNTFDKSASSCETAAGPGKMS